MTPKETIDSVMRDFDHPRGGVEERMDSDIRRFRKGWGRFVVTDAEGKPVQGAKLSLRQKTHEFLFGCSLFKLGDFPTEKENSSYENRFRQVFNNATCPFYWDALEPEPGKLRYSSGSERISRRPPPDFTVNWCLENGIRPKGHWLFCDNFVPKWLPKNSRDLMILLEKRIADLGARYGGKVTLWDAVNEAFTNPRWFDKKIGWSVTPPDYVFEVFKLAEKYFPNHTEFCYNDSGYIAFQHFHFENSPLYLLCQSLLNRGARLGGIGFQFHMLGNAWEFQSGCDAHSYWFDPVRQFRVFDQYSRLNLPVHITEISLPAYSDLPKKEGRELQARMVRAFYKLWFSQKDMESIVYWNLADGTAFVLENHFESGLLDKDLNPKPAFEVLDELVNHEWHTECTVVTDENGIADWNGFFGTYEMTVAVGRSKIKRETSLLKSGCFEEHFSI